MPAKKNNCAHNQKQKSLEASRQPKCRRNEACTLQWSPPFFSIKRQRALSKFTRAFFFQFSRIFSLSFAIILPALIKVFFRRLFELIGFVFNIKINNIKFKITSIHSVYEHSVLISFYGGELQITQTYTKSNTLDLHFDRYLFVYIKISKTKPKK